MTVKNSSIKIDLVNKFLIVFLSLIGLVIISFTLYRQIKPGADQPKTAEFFTAEPQETAVFLMGESSYLYSKDIDGNQHILSYLQSYLQDHWNCSFTISTPSINEFEDSSYRIWGDPFERDELGLPISPIDRDINSISQFIAAKNFVNNAKDNHKQPIVIIGHGTNESKDIVDSANTGKTLDKFHNYLNQAKSELENIGAAVIIATPVKGCPFPERNYQPEGVLKNLSQQITGWYDNTADIFGAFANRSCTNTDPCPDPEQCLTRCLINVNPFNSDGFPNRTCQMDYAHPNHDGYTLMAKTIGDSIINLNLCSSAVTPTPTPTLMPESDYDKLKKGDLNLDGTINSIDWSIMKAGFFSATTLAEGDLNEDGIVNSLDWSIMKSHFWENS